MIISSEETLFITQDLLKDSVYLHDNLVRYLKSIGKRPKHLYTQAEMYNMFDKMRYVETHEIHKLDDNLSYEFFNSGHVVGGTQLKLYFNLPNNSKKTLVYTSDLGSNYNLDYKPFIKEKDIIPSANMYVFEATYSNSDRCFNKKQAIEERKKLKKVISDRLKNGKRIFFPSFSFGRTQELMDLLYSFFKDETWFRDMNIPITIDGKLTNTICGTYSRILKDEDKEKWEEIKNWKHFNYNKEYEGTKILLAKRQCGIYISSSGFIQPKTRSCDYVKNFMGREGDLIIFVGFYGGQYSIGQELVESANGTPIKIDNTTLIKSCDVMTFSSFSSHIQQDEIFSYWKQVSADKILIHHCTEEGKQEMMEKGKIELSKVNKTTKIISVGKHASQFVL